ncbi:helix-turn-helix domain-containing protein [Actinoallomurus iriomotensis]|uniref:Transcriptional regulator n=1 Tax=Actinoallomurus iriomotensis TaxID=478107 RepID=A0A9W6S117_9ACTN|nr:helix-turn-helix transcriptional regulator [Actinoallomurus iriomotensis]GLY86516.1 transcriptional regulator [Actinoallomurus iriomotensis]
MALADELDPLGSLHDWVAFDLRRYRLAHGMSQADVGRILNVRRSAVHNYESGLRPLDIEHARKLDSAWDTCGHFERLVTHANQQHDSGWFQQFLRYERRAKIIRAYEALVIPGLLQTPDYARAFLIAGGVPDVDAAVKMRIERQQVLDRDPPPRLSVLLDEGILSRPVGGKAVMRAQLAYLLEAGERPNVSIRVVPIDVGEHLGLDGSFEVIETENDTVAYLEAQGGGRLDRGTKGVERMMVNYDRIGDQALPVNLSRRLMETAMEAMT